MLFAIDAGNTNITIGIFDKEDLIGTYRLTTKVRRTSDEYGFMLKNFLDRSNVHEKQIDSVIVSSVVPKVMHSFTNEICFMVFSVEFTPQAAYCKEVGNATN